MRRLLFILMVLILMLGMIACSQPADEGALQSPEGSSEGEANPDASNDVKIDSGRYIGQADSNFIEIKISGVPDEMDPSVFMLSDEAKEGFDALDLETEDNVQVKYYINENNQKVITKITKI